MNATRNGQSFKPNLLCVVPPYGNRIPAGCAYLLGYLKAHGCHDFDFLDLRLGAPFDFTPTYRTTGAFGESYVLDLPDLPLVLDLMRRFEQGSSLVPERSPWLDRYCLERGISPHYLLSYLASIDQYVERCFAQVEQIDFIGFATWTPNFLATLFAAAHLKRRRRPPFIVAGGPQVSASPASAELGLRSGLFDVVAVGEAEQTLLELYEKYRSTGGVADVGGTIFLNPVSNTLERVERKLLRLESLPLPSFEEMPLPAYLERTGLRALPFQLSRGCTDKCSFCSEWVFWRHYRSDAPDHAVEQLKELLPRYNAAHIEFSDSLLNGHPKRLIGFAEAVLSQGLEFGWTSFMRAQMDKPTAQLLARSGCTGVFIGIESFSDEALALMNKRCTEAQNIQAVVAFAEAGIYVTAGFIPGFPGDSRQGFLHSVEVLRELQDRYPGRISLHEEPFTVMANAPIMNKLESMGLTGVPWAEEYIDILPACAEVSRRVLCSVEGREQGLERIGRTSLVGAMKTDSPEEGSFEEGSDEEIFFDRFTALHIFGGWHLAYKRTRAGHRYCLLLSDAEWEELQDAQQEWFPLIETQPAVEAHLDTLEARHVIPPSRSEQKVVRSLFSCDDYARSTLALSPYMIARRLGWRHGHQTLFVHTITSVSLRRTEVDARIAEALLAGPLCGESLWCAPRIREHFRDREKFFARLEQLKDLGVLTICEREADDPCAVASQTSAHAELAATGGGVLNILADIPS
jgi:hypothetical protein